MSSRICILICLAAFGLFIACEREYAFHEGNQGLSFSTDTVAFDTVFTSVGSSTHNLRVYNSGQDDFMIEAIELAGGDDSDFILNVDGNAGSMIYDVPIRKSDSLFVFVEVNVNPSDENAPFVVSDSIMFYTRDRVQTVHLLAYGQNVVPLRKEHLKTRTLTNEKPYLIYDWVVVDSAETLTIDPGARLHFHKDAFFIVFGSLQVKGEVNNPVLFASDRMEEWYADKPGQWGYVHLMPGSRDHSINNALIRNGTKGLVVDSIGMEDDEPPLYLNNVKIEHVSSQGLIAQNSSIVASNSVFADCGSASVALTIGGNYQFYHCTIANYFSWTFRNTPALVISNYFTDADNKVRYSALEGAGFHNCIVYGKNENEVKLDFKENPDEDEGALELANVDFSHSLIKVGKDKIESYSQAINSDVLLNENPAFIDVEEYNYQLDSLSSAIEAGDPGIARDYPLDILGNSRVEGVKAPDIGAYQRGNN